jgi:hypothetical protein
LKIGIGYNIFLFLHVQFCVVPNKFWHRQFALERNKVLELKIGIGYNIFHLLHVQFCVVPDKFWHRQFALNREKSALFFGKK